jgi:hypothetical protein
VWEVDKITVEYAFPAFLFVPTDRPAPKPDEELCDTRTIPHSSERRTERGKLSSNPKSSCTRCLSKCGKLISVGWRIPSNWLKLATGIEAPDPFNVVEYYRGHGVGRWLESVTISICNLLELHIYSLSSFYVRGSFYGHGPF